MNLKFIGRGRTETKGLSGQPWSRRSWAAKRRAGERDAARFFSAIASNKQQPLWYPSTLISRWAPPGRADGPEGTGNGLRCYCLSLQDSDSRKAFQSSFRRGTQRQQRDSEELYTWLGSPIFYETLRSYARTATRSFNNFNTRLAAAVAGHCYGPGRLMEFINFKAGFQVRGLATVGVAKLASPTLLLPWLQAGLGTALRTSTIMTRIRSVLWQLCIYMQKHALSSHSHIYATGAYTCLYMHIICI